MKEVLTIFGLAALSILSTTAFVGWLAILPTIDLLWSLGWLR